MLKKIFAAMFLSAVIFVTAQSQVEAREIYVGSYSDGTSVYLLTETVVFKSYSPLRFSCRVRAGYDYLNYSFYPYNGSPYYRNNEGYSGFVFGGQSPVAAGIYRYVRDSY